MIRQPTGFVRNSVVSNVRCKYIEAEGCVLINVTAERITAKPGSIIYNFVQGNNSNSGSSDNNDNLVAVTAAGDVIVGVFAEDGAQTVIRSHIDTDGGEWRRE